MMDTPKREHKMSSGRFRLSNGEISSVPKPKVDGAIVKSENRMEPTGEKSLTDELYKFVFFDKFDIYQASRLLVQRARTADIWPETETFLREIAKTVIDTVRPPPVFNFSSEEVAYSNQLQNLLYRYTEKAAPVKIVQAPAISQTILTKIGTQWSTTRIKWNIINKDFHVKDEWIQSFSTKERCVKKIARQFLFHLLLQITDPPEKIKKFTVRTTRSSNSGFVELPNTVLSELMRMVEEGFNLNRWELSEDVSENRLSTSTWFRNLSKTGSDCRNVRARILEFRRDCRPNFTEILKNCFPEVRRCVRGGSQLTRVHHVTQKRQIVAEEDEMRTPVKRTPLRSPNEVYIDNLPSTSANHSVSTELRNVRLEQENEEEEYFENMPTHY